MTVVKKVLRATALGLLIFVLLPSIDAGAEIGETSKPHWGVFDRDDDVYATDRLRVEVFALEQIGDRIFVGGRFTTTRPWRTSSTQESQPYAPAFDVNSGKFIDSWRPVLDGAVYALEASPDGSRLYVGGEFSNANGVSGTEGLAALDPNTGQVVSGWKSWIDRRLSNAPVVVYALDTDNSHVYAAGSYDTIGAAWVNGRPERAAYRAARFVHSNGKDDPNWVPQITGGSVWAIHAPGGGNRAYIGGYHSSVNGASQTAFMTVVNGSTGAPLNNVTRYVGNVATRNYVQDIESQGTRVFAAASEHILWVFNRSNMDVVRTHSTDAGLYTRAQRGRGGDYQDLEIVGDRLYASCHCYNTHFEDYDFWGEGQVLPPVSQMTEAHGILAYSVSTGAYIPSFSPDISYRREGPWAIHGNGECLWIGGDVTRTTKANGGNRGHGGFAKMCDPDAPDSTPPTAPTNLAAPFVEKFKITMSWSKSTDNVAVDRYDIYRDNTLIATKTSNNSTIWYSDPGLTRNTTYTYRIEAVDAAGNATPSSDLTETTRP